MLNKDDYQHILSKFVAGCKEIFGDKLCDVILFGSFARGDYDDDSDIDLMIIVDMDDADARKLMDDVYEISSDIDLQYGTLLSPLVRSKRDFDFRKTVSDFYQNVEQEGVSMHAGRQLV
jgi:predicted nucleotidyltransferase